MKESNNNKNIDENNSKKSEDKRNIENSKEQNKKYIKEEREEYYNISQTWIIIGAVILLLLIFSGIFFFAKTQSKQLTIEEMLIENLKKKPTENNYVYNGYSFIKMADPRTSRLFWYTQFQIKDTIYTLPMHYGPKELENIPLIFINPIPEGNYSILYITIDPKEYNIERPYLALAVSELSEKLAKIKNYKMESACTENITESCYARKIINCENTKDQMIIYYKDNVEEPSIKIDKNCIILEGKGENLLKVTDKIIYVLLKIMTK